MVRVFWAVQGIKGDNCALIQAHPVGAQPFIFDSLPSQIAEHFICKPLHTGLKCCSAFMQRQLNMYLDNMRDKFTGQWTYLYSTVHVSPAAMLFCSSSGSLTWGSWQLMPSVLASPFAWSCPCTLLLTCCEFDLKFNTKRHMLLVHLSPNHWVHLLGTLGNAELTKQCEAHTFAWPTDGHAVEER